MSTIVQKFGGSSVADVHKIQAAARRAIAAQKEGHQVVVVVSAMGDETDRLRGLAKQIAVDPPAREMDMLLATGEQVAVALMAMAIHSLGHQAISMTGAQLGILTDSVHTRARIRMISTDRIHKALAAGNIVIAAGFQGIDESGNITTLGPGGSDITAVALAAVLGAERCEVHTDVDGVYTTDPRIVSEARLLRRVSYDEMLELASAGADVVHYRAIQFAKKFNVLVQVRNSSGDSPGTIIGHESESAASVCGVALAADEARVTALGVPNRPGAALAIVSKVAARNILIDMIVQNEASDGRTDFSFTVRRDDLPGALRAVDEAVDELGAEGRDYDDDVSKISIVGVGLANRPGVAGTMFRALAEHGINIQIITTTEIKISVVVERSLAHEALRAVHEAFELQTPQTSPTPAEPPPASPRKPNTAALVAGLQRLEKLLVADISLDETQGRVTFLGLSDIPGLAAQIFDELAESGVVVGMIVQSIGRRNRASISVTVPREQVDQTLRIASEQAELLGCPPPTHCPKVAKLSVFGAGMKSNTGVAVRMFDSLAKSGVNADLISTCEVRVNVVVDGRHGHKALGALKRELADVMG